MRTSTFHLVALYNKCCQDLDCKSTVKFDALCDHCDAYVIGCGSGTIVSAISWWPRWIQKLDQSTPKKLSWGPEALHHLKGVLQPVGTGLMVAPQVSVTSHVLLAHPTCSSYCTPGLLYRCGAWFLSGPNSVPPLYVHVHGTHTLVHASLSFKDNIWDMLETCNIPQ